MFMGLDPGVSGGIAAVDHNGLAVFAKKMPEDMADILGILRMFPIEHACIEHVWSSPQQGVASAFTFGRGFGSLLMALTACEIPFEKVTPQTWQKFMGCRTAGDKNVSKAKAQTLWPEMRCTHATSDALLIAEYARRSHQLKGSSRGQESSQVPQRVRPRQEENPARRIADQIRKHLQITQHR